MTSYAFDKVGILCVRELLTHKDRPKLYQFQPRPTKTFGPLAVLTRASSVWFLTVKTSVQTRGCRRTSSLVSRTLSSEGLTARDTAPFAVICLSNHPILRCVFVSPEGGIGYPQSSLRYFTSFRVYVGTFDVIALS